MEPIIYKTTINTPDVILNNVTGEFIISGRSLPENAKEFYDPILDWLLEYFESPNKETKFIFEIIYFNTASSKMILDILFILTKAFKDGHKVQIIWRYEKEDEDLEQAGNDYSSIIKIPIRMEPIES